jgi:hypothetical protein
MAQGTQRPDSLPLGRSGARAAADPSFPPTTSGLPDTASRPLRMGTAWRDVAATSRDRLHASTDESVDGLIQARQLYRHPRMQRLAKRSA